MFLGVIQGGREREITHTQISMNKQIFYLSHAGLKSMVVQGVKNPLVDLLSLDDKTLDEVNLIR